MVGEEEVGVVVVGEGMIKEAGIERMIVGKA